MPFKKQIKLTFLHSPHNDLRWEMSLHVGYLFFKGKYLAWKPGHQMIH